MGESEGHALLAEPATPRHGGTLSDVIETAEQEQGRVSSKHRDGFYLGASAILLVAAAVLRFQGLLGDSLLWLDEAVAVQNASGSLSELLANVRANSSAAIAWPLLLHVIQGLDASTLAIRLGPALAGTLAIAAMLFLLPRVGVSRVAALLAALLATLSEEMVRQAWHAREYSIDALLAVLIIVGWLAFLREGKARLLCCVLFIGPLLHYGLALFGFAAVATLVLARAASWRRDGSANWRTDAARLALPLAAWGAGSASTWLLTLRHQGIASLQDSPVGWDLSDYIYSGEAGDIASLASFLLTHAWHSITHYVPEPVAAPALAAVGIALALRLAGKTAGGAIPALFAFALAVAMAAAALRLHPLGNVRPTFYLAPMFCIAFGHAVAVLAALAPGLWRLAAASAVAAGMAFAGASAVAGATPGVQGDAAAFRKFLKDDVADTPVFATSLSLPIVQFYSRQEQMDAHYGEPCHWEDRDACIEALLAGLVNLHRQGSNQVWVLSFVRDYAELQVNRWRLAGHADIVSNGTVHSFFIRDLGLVLERRLRALEAWGQLQAQGLTFDDQFRAFLDSQGNRVFYGKEACQRFETWGTFLLRVLPQDKEDLAPDQRALGMENLDFEFEDAGTRFEGRCLIAAVLPDYAIERVDVGQAQAGGAIKWAQSFSVGIARKAWALLNDDAVPDRSAGGPLIRGVFDVYRIGRTLVYARERCQTQDTLAPIFLRVTPARTSDLPAALQEQGFQEQEWPFDVIGARDLDTCLAVATLPDYGIAAIETGQRAAPDAGGWTGTAPSG